MAVNEAEAVILHHQKFKTKILSINETDGIITVESYLRQGKGDYQEILELGDPETYVEEL
jgi:hypothetical protein